MKTHYKPRANVRFHQEITEAERLKASEIVSGLCEHYCQSKVSIILEIPYSHVSYAKNLSKDPYFHKYKASPKFIRKILAWQALLEEAAPSFCAPHKESANGAA